MASLHTGDWVSSTSLSAVVYSVSLDIAPVMVARCFCRVAGPHFLLIDISLTRPRMAFAIRCRLSDGLIPLIRSSHSKCCRRCPCDSPSLTDFCNVASCRIATLSKIWRPVFPVIGRVRCAQLA